MPSTTICDNHMGMLSSHRDGNMLWTPAEIGKYLMELQLEM